MRRKIREPIEVTDVEFEEIENAQISPQSQEVIEVEAEVVRPNIFTSSGQRVIYVTTPTDHFSYGKDKDFSFKKQNYGY